MQYHIYKIPIYIYIYLYIYTTYKYKLANHTHAKKNTHFFQNKKSSTNTYSCKKYTHPTTNQSFLPKKHILALNNTHTNQNSTLVPAIEFTSDYINKLQPMNFTPTTHTSSNTNMYICLLKHTTANKIHSCHKLLPAAQFTANITSSCYECTIQPRTHSRQ